ncbi:unnamed protein product [Closterium sp. Yama58-4]|nr:unnamed protein product [Closterium sp. Yama58-4]
MVLSFLAPAYTPLAYAAPHRNVSLPLLLLFRYLANNHLSGTLPAAISQLENLQQIWLDNNNIEGPLPAGMCSLPWLWSLDVSSNSLYGRINRDFVNIGADDNALVNLAHNFFFGDGVLFAAGCKVCPTEINEPRNLGTRDTFSWEYNGGKCGNLALNNPVINSGKTTRVSLSGNCLTLTPNNKCSSNATQRSTAACQAFCSITDNGPCDGHGACVPAAPASPSNFTCLCDAGYSAVDSGNGSSTCAIVHSTTTTNYVSSLSTGTIVGIVLGSFAGFSLLASVVAWLLWPRGPKKWEGLDVCEQFSLQQMLSATNNWSEDNVLGKGGFGVVYKGRSPQGQLWAIKRSTIMTNDFETEVMLIARTLHCSLYPCSMIVCSFGIVLLQMLSGKTPQVNAKTHIGKWAVKLVETYDVEELRDSNMPAVDEEAIVDFADLALDCIKSPGTRRPTMKDVAYRLSALIDKHCPNEEDERENVVTEEGTSNQGMPSESSGDGGREPERSYGSQSSVISFTGTFSMSDSLKSWLQMKPAKER